MIYAFDEPVADAGFDLSLLLGGKGKNLNIMSSIGIPIPPGFTISTDVFHMFEKDKAPSNGDISHLSDKIKDMVALAVNKLEAKTGKSFAMESSNPLLVSVRSGAPISMPGMMDTVLNIGLNKFNASVMCDMYDERFVYDSYRRLIQMYGSVVHRIPSHLFDEEFNDIKQSAGCVVDSDLRSDDLLRVLSAFERIFSEQAGIPFPEDPWDELFYSVAAVFNSWYNDRAKEYRRIYSILDSYGTAVNVQAMVFGNMNQASATGVCFSRNPVTGEEQMYGEFLQNAQGEDVVAGIRTPVPINIYSAMGSKGGTMEEEMPALYNELVGVAKLLEGHYKDMQDIEFTIEDGKLWILQTRSAKRNAKAAIVCAAGMVRSGLISKKEALNRVSTQDIETMLYPIVDSTEHKPITSGLPASPGAISGAVIFSSSEAVKAEKPVILVRSETNPDDIEGINSSAGMLTSRGGMTSHAAVVARGLGKPCVTGASALSIDEMSGTFTVGDTIVRENDIITINGSNGDIFLGEVPTKLPEVPPEYTLLLSWAKEESEISVMVNGDTVHDISQGLKFDIAGVGLCRTEHMFFEPQRMLSFQSMIISDSQEERQRALDSLISYQKQDFEELLELLDGASFTVRLLDPPLHEFLPESEENIRKLADELSMSYEHLHAQCVKLKEENPMMGHRGCRLAVTYPEICMMQARALFSAMESVGVVTDVKIMVPFVACVKEFSIIRRLIDSVADEISSELKYEVGAMIELPSAALNADKIAIEADFLSFGTNDLTQFTYGLSRDDYGKFLHYYEEKGIFEKDPFTTIEQTSVGRLIEMAVQAARGVKEDISIGVCGEHGGDPESIAFCRRIGLDYVSCSPYRIPIALLCAGK